MEDTLNFLASHWLAICAVILFCFFGYLIKLADDRWERKRKEANEAWLADRAKARDEYLAEWKQQVAHYEQAKKPPIKTVIKEVKPRPPKPVIKASSKEERRAYKERLREEEAEDARRRFAAILPISLVTYPADVAPEPDRSATREFGGGNSDGGGASGSWDSSSGSSGDSSSGGSDSGGSGGGGD